MDPEPIAADPASLRAQADRLLRAFATSDTAAVPQLVDPAAEIIGTDPGEHWRGLEEFLPALEGMRELDLSADWLEAPTVGGDWVSGIAIYRAGDGDPIETRVTMVFEAGYLVHAHFSVAVPMLD